MSFLGRSEGEWGYAICKISVNLGDFYQSISVGEVGTGMGNGTAKCCLSCEVFFVNIYHFRIVKFAIL